MIARGLSAVVAAALLSGCAAFPEFDGKPVAALRASDLQRPLPQEMVITAKDFGDPGLRQMIAEADVNGLDLAAARARAMLADLALAQAATTRLPQPSGTAALTDKAATATLSLGFEVDLSGRIASALRTAELEHQAAGVDLLIARRTLLREVIQGWVTLGEARTAAARAEARRALAQRQVVIVEARLAAGEITAASLTEALQRVATAEEAAAQAPGQIALAEARLRALGVTTIPPRIDLGRVHLPRIPEKTDLGLSQGRPEVCLAFLQFKAADSARADALLASRPRLVLTTSATQTARSLAALLSGNLAPLATSVSLDGALLDNGDARRRVDRARIATAQAEIAWLQAQARGEIAILDATVELAGARAALTAAQKGHAAAEAELNRSRARKAAGEADEGGLIEAELAVLDAQATIDTTRARAIRSAVLWQDAIGPGRTDCSSAE
jgi:multidrug efflux system outer membrane protein